jgi:hypothetical protein
MLSREQVAEEEYNEQAKERLHSLPVAMAASALRPSNSAQAEGIPTLHRIELNTVAGAKTPAVRGVSRHA